MWQTRCSTGAPSHIRSMFPWAYYTSASAAALLEAVSRLVMMITSHPRIPSSSGPQETGQLSPVVVWWKYEGLTGSGPISCVHDLSR